MAKGKLKSVPLPPLVELVESFKHEMKMQGKKWKKMDSQQTIIELQLFLANEAAVNQDVQEGTGE